jgi:hypothetical protein
VPQIASVISAKADMDGQQVSLATAVEVPLTELRAAFGAPDEVSPGVRLIGPAAETAPSSRNGGAKFVRP